MEEVTYGKFQSPHVYLVREDIRQRAYTIFYEANKYEVDILKSVLLKMDHDYSSKVLAFYYNLDELEDKMRTLK